MRIFEAEAIEASVDRAGLIDGVAQGLAEFSAGDVVVPPVGLPHFDEPPGDVHIKYGFVRGADHYIVKIASGFYENPGAGLPTADGIVLVFSSSTGILEAILADRGYLTELRTGAAGAVAARLLAPREVTRIGMVGAGVQGRFQMRMLRHVIVCESLLAWSRTPERLEPYAAEMAEEGFSVDTTTDLAEVTATCNLIVTATPAEAPLLMQEAIRPGTHITALGSDNLGKQELDPRILVEADIVAADSRSQALHHGESAHALAVGLDEGRIVELGDIVAGREEGRTGDDQVTVADLTGVAVEDIVAAEMALAALA